MRLSILIPIFFLSLLFVVAFSEKSSAQTTSPWLQQNRGKISELENKLTTPSAINVTVRQGQVVRVTGGARRFARPVDNIDQILITKFAGNFECLDKTGTNRAANYVDTHELKGFWFIDENNSKSAKGFRGYAAVEGAFDDRDRVMYNTQELVQICEGLMFPEGEITTIPMERSIELGALCVGEKKGSVWVDFDYVIYEVVNSDTYTLNLTCDNRLSKATRASRRTADGRFIQRCPEGMHINGTHNEVAYTRTTKPKYCRGSERAQKIMREYEAPASNVYEVWCPDGYFVKNSDMKYSVSTQRYPPGDYLCYPYRYTWTQKKG